MTLRDKVIKGLECCSTHFVGMSCGNCPYEIEQDEELGINECTAVLAYDALELLKGQKECVLCKDCKHGEKTPNPYRENETWCNLFETNGYHPDEWHCAEGAKST